MASALVPYVIRSRELPARSRTAAAELAARFPAKPPCQPRKADA